MPHDLRETWNDLASNWDDWASPLRPAEEDLRLLRHALTEWQASHYNQKANVFLCGVTPEIAAMPWSFPIDLIGMDQAESMTRLVWPGDVPGLRRAVVGDWLHSGLPPQSQDIVLGDGGFVFFTFPDGQRALMRALHALLKPDGLLVYRHFAQAPRRESPQEVVAAARGGHIGNFHAFKFRLAMALQNSAADGVRQHDIWQAWHDAKLEPAALPQPGWSLSAVGTIRYYRGKHSRLFFPTLAEFTELLGEFFGDVSVAWPSYEFGERCPTITARPLASPRA